MEWYNAPEIGVLIFLILKYCLCVSLEHAYDINRKFFALVQDYSTRFTILNPELNEQITIAITLHFMTKSISYELELYLNVHKSVTLTTGHYEIRYISCLRWVQRNIIALIIVVFPDSKVHGASMGPIWDRQDPGGPHVGPMNFAIWDWLYCCETAPSKLVRRSIHDDILIRERLLYYWPFLRGIQGWPVTKLQNKQSMTDD